MTTTLLNGATTPPPEFAYAKDAGEFAARWNESTPQSREMMLLNLNRAFDRSRYCFERDHEDYIRHLETENRRLLTENMALKSRPAFQSIPPLPTDCTGFMPQFGMPIVD